jgi:hypothetical protein
MCTNVTVTAPVSGCAHDGDDWRSVDRFAVYFDHPQELLADHAMCIDVWDGRERRVVLELDAASARRLADAIVEVLGAREVQDVLQPLAVAHQRHV